MGRVILFDEHLQRIDEAQCSGIDVDSSTIAEVVIGYGKVRYALYLAEREMEFHLFKVQHDEYSFVVHRVKLS